MRTSPDYFTFRNGLSSKMSFEEVFPKSLEPPFAALKATVASDAEFKASC